MQEKKQMNTRGVANVLAAILFATSLLWGSVAHGQDPKPSPSSATVATNTKPADETAKTTTAAPAQTPAPSPSPKPDFWHREQLSGDWDGDRERVENEGFEIELKLTQFY